MKTETSPEQDNHLRKLLGEWKINSSLPPRLQEDVWRRIASAETPPIHPLTWLWMWLSQRIARPSFVYSYATILLTTGLLGGFWQARESSHRASETLSARYVQMIDPYQVRRP